MGRVSVAVLLDLDQELEGVIAPPTKKLKIVVEGQDLSRFEFIRHLDETRIGEINRMIAIFGQNSLNAANRIVQLKRNLEDARGHILEDQVSQAREVAEKMTGLGNHGLTCHKRRR